MIGMMATGRDAFADDVNKFNRAMNLGHESATWFSDAFGSTQCRSITGCDFSTTEGVNQYIDTDGVARCQGIARQVAAKVERMIASAVYAAKSSAPFVMGRHQDDSAARRQPPNGRQ